MSNGKNVSNFDEFYATLRVQQKQELMKLSIFLYHSERFKIPHLIQTCNTFTIVFFNYLSGSSCDSPYQQSSILKMTTIFLPTFISAIKKQCRILCCAIQKNIYSMQFNSTIYFPTRSFMRLQRYFAAKNQRLIYEAPNLLLMIIYHIEV